MKQRGLGHDLIVGAIGFGCLGLSRHRDESSETTGIAAIHRALDLGITLFDTAAIYGDGHNESILGRALRDRRATAVVASKIGRIHDPDAPGKLTVDGSPAFLRAACERSLRRLGIDVIDLLYLHRVDPKVPIEESIGAMAELVKAGKVRCLGLSEAGVTSIRRAQRVHPITALQAEWSIFSRDPEHFGTYAVCEELQIGFVAYGALGRGLLGDIKQSSDILPEDHRIKQPRFKADCLSENLALAARIRALAETIGCSLNQVALAWVLSRGPSVVPIPGMERPAQVESNIAAAAVVLTQDQLAEIDGIAPFGAAKGERQVDMASLNG